MIFIILMYFGQMSLQKYIESEVLNINYRIKCGFTGESPHSNGALSLSVCTFCSLIRVEF